jgi:hypothetical protein
MQMVTRAAGTAREALRPVRSASREMGGEEAFCARMFGGSDVYARGGDPHLINSGCTCCPCDVSSTTRVEFTGEVGLGKPTSRCQLRRTCRRGEALVRDQGHAGE